MADTIERLVVEYDANLTKINAKLDSLNRSVHSSVTRASKDVGDLDKKWGGLLQSPNPAKAFDSLFSRARLGLIEEGGARIGVFGSALEDLGPIGVAAGAGIAAAFLAMEETKGAIEYAENVERLSKTLHMTTDEVQLWAFAFKSAGVDVAAGDQALQQFSVRLGQADDGMKRAQRWFTAIGFTPAQVKSFHDTDDALRQVIGRIGELKSQDQDAVIQGLGLEALKPLILEGAAALDDLFAKGRAMGAVLDENLIHKGASAAVEYRQLADIIDVQLKSAFIDLAPVLTGLLTWAAKFARAIGDIADDLRGIENKTSRGIERELASNERMQTDPLANLGGLLTGHLKAQHDELAKRLADLDADQAAPAGPPPASRGLIPTTASHAKHAPSDDNATALDAAEKAEIAAHKTLLEALLGQTPIYLDQTDQIMAIAAIEAQEVDAEQKAADDRAKKLLAEKHITQATYDQVVAKDAQAAADKKQVITLQAQQKVLEQNLAATDAMLAWQGAILASYDQVAQINQTLATTAADRKAIGQRQLLLDQAHERFLVEQQVNDQAMKEHWTPEFAANAMAERMGALSDLQAAQQKQFDFDNLSPIQKWRDAAVKAAADVQTAMENVEVEGLNAFTDNLAGLIAGTESLNQAWKNVYQTVVTSVAKMAIQKYVTLPIANMLGLGDVAAPISGAMATGGATAGTTIATAITTAGAGAGATIATTFSAAGAAVAAQLAAAMAAAGAASGAGQALGDVAAVAAEIPPFAAGTNFAPGGLALVGENGPELVNLPRGSQVIPNPRLRNLTMPSLTAPSVSRAGGQTIILQVQANDYFDARVDARSAAVAGVIVQHAAPAIAMGGAAVAREQAQAKQAKSLAGF